MYVVLFVLGLALIVAAVYGLLGPWAALAVAGVLLVVLGILGEAGDRRAAKPRARTP